MRTIRVPVIFEDNHLLVVEKPPNMLSQEDITSDMDLLNLLKEDIKQRDMKKGNVFLGLVHRLDRPVGGVMVFAKTSKCAGRLGEQFRSGRVERTYLAVVHGSFAMSEGRLVHHLVKDRQKNMVYAVDSHMSGAKEAVLDYEVVGKRGGLSLMKISLITGRSHQIRVQFASIGHPLWGDQKYGLKQSDARKQIALWAYRLCVLHPTLKTKMSFSSAPKGVPWDSFELFA